MGFQSDKLFLSIYESLKHREGAIEDARSLAESVIGRLDYKTQKGIFSTELIKETTVVCLSRFDKAAGTHYRAFHP